ncbi:MAG TPA: PP2C family protein-serine/threonine phosphatase [Solirubrobacteraceae bacterium]|nr:PP2C family protein-serine/threonine phosphatase [Solirubrobacteraceae bacterium]
MPELRSLPRRWRHVAGIGLVTVGLCAAPAAVSADAGPHGGGPVAYGPQEQAQWQGPGQSGWGGHGGPGQGQGGSGQGWGGGDGGPGQGPPSWAGPQSGHDQGGSGDQGQGGGSGGWGDSGQGNGGWGGAGQTQAAPPATPQVATPSATVASSGNGAGNGNGNGDGNGQGASGGWGGAAHGRSGGSDGWGNGHGWGSGSNSGWGSHANGNQGNSSSATATPSVSTASKPTTVTPATTSATGSSAPAAPAAAAPSTPPAAAAPVPVSVNPAQPSTPSSPAANPKRSTSAHRHRSAPAGKSRQRPSRHVAAGRGASSRGGARRPARTGLLGLTKIASGLANGARAFTGSTGHSAAGTTAAPLHHRHAAAESPVLRPFNTLGHELSAVPALVGGLVPLPVPDWSKPIIAALLIVCALLALRAMLISHRASRLESEHTQLAADLAAIQTALIPEIPPALGGLDVSVAYRPADGPGAGGDFYDVFALGGDRVAIIVGDVSGHGRDALGRAAHMHYTLRAYVEMGLEPRAALKLAGRVLGADEDDLFTTVAVAVHDADAATLTYATAGHPAPLLAGPGAHEPLTRCASPALGWGAPTGRRQTSISFPQGARACFFTDGVTEARVGDGLLGRERLADMVSTAGPGLAASELLERVQERANGIHDDMAACIVEATVGSVLCDRRIEELEVDARQIAAGQVERFLVACGVAAGEVDAIIAEARETAAEHGAALLRVELEADEAIPSVTGPGVGRPELQQA